MTVMLDRLGPMALAALLCCGTAACEEDPPAEYPSEARPPPAPPAPPSQTPAGEQPPPPTGAPSQPPPAPPAAAQAAPPPPDGQDVAPPQAQWVYSYPTGQWVYTSGYGWVWVPAGTSSASVEGAPYSYLYTPAYGWTWYLSPWGWGPYHYGGWVRHPWHPVGWRGGWVGRPRFYGGRYGGGHWHRR